jgi:DNA polymerase
MVGPNVVVALGATASRALIGPDFRLTESRGVLLDPAEPHGPRRIATVHPSAILRLRNADERASSREQLAADLAVAAAAAGM